MSGLTNMTHEVTLPLGGNNVVLRGMTGHEEDMLTDKKLIKQGKAMDKILHACLESIDGAKPSESDVLNLASSDRTFLLVEVRKLSYGETIENAELKCQNKDCNEKTIYDIDLSTLPITVNEEGTQDEFEITLPVTGTLVKFRHQNGYDEQKLVKFGEGEVLTVGIMLRLTEVADVHPNGYKKWLKGLPVRDRSALRKAIEASEVGLDTAITVVCDECGNENRYRVESLPAFFFPEM